MRNFIYLLLLICAPILVLADEVKIEINPPKPVAGEVFQAYFRIFTDAAEAPEINFSPGGVEVVNKSNQGVSTRTIYANGQLSVTRELTVVYDLVANKAGLAQLKDINVQLGAKKIRHPLINITVMKEAEVMPDVFVMADVPKKKVFLGEGITVRYYLYSKVPVSNLDVKKYPKLNNFLKRFLQEADRSERVTVDGNLFLRTQIYAAKLFPEKLGDLKIDPLQLSATVASSRTSDPFSGFGLSRDFRTKTISSETVKIEVRPLPLPTPKHFTGLVGKHDFDLQFGPSRLIVNEPLEIKLAISGNGALENLEAPEIIHHQGLEAFETNGDLKISSPEEATKIFNYTFLAQQNLQIDASNLTLSYFDPDEEKYVTVSLDTPEIVVAGGGAVKSKDKDRKEPAVRHQKVDDPKLAPVPAVSLEGPVFEMSKAKQWIPMVNIGLAGLALLIALGWTVSRQGMPHFSSSVAVPKVFKQGQFELSEFLRWLSPIITKTGKTPLAVIRESNLSEDSKRYFVDLLNANDYKNYSSSKSQFQFKFQSKYFKELGKYIESVTNESTS